MLRLRSPAPEIRLVNSFMRPFDGAVAAARTCYSPKGIVSPEEVAGEGLEEGPARLERLARRDALARDIYRAGHHTVFQHAHFQFTIDRISRHALWSFFHAHPFYNSEQVSQRYVRVRPGTFLVPELTAPQLVVYERVAALQQEAYHRLTKTLEPVAASAFFEVFPSRAKQKDRWGKQIRRKAQEAARYVLPVATWARLYHTISAITLLRYHRIAEQHDVPSEVRLVVDRMLAQVLKVEPAFEVVLEASLKLEQTAEASVFGAIPLIDPERADIFHEQFDDELGGRVTRLVGWAEQAETLVAQAVRDVLGFPRETLCDSDAIALAADPARNAVYGEALNVTTLSKLTRALHHAQYTFRRRISHTADSQDQRHRMTPGSRPLLLAHLSNAPDVINPSLIEEDEASLRDFDETMARVWEGLAELRALGAPEEALIYLLPNAAAVRFTESADYLALRHKHAMRLCYNAQEEIWRACRDEALQVREVHPRLGAHLLPPCAIRKHAGQTPLCPEGPRYCGIPVWRFDPSEYTRRI